MAPFALADFFGKTGEYVIYLLIGMSFGAVLEMSGFAISTKLTGQFYLRDQTVFKVMFTGVIVAMVLIFGSVALGLLDFNRVWVPPTYLWPGIVGGFLIGVGFIIGGFCPGTSIVGVATGKIDALFFVGGVLAGAVVFGEFFDYFDAFYNSSYMGRLTLPDWLGVSTGLLVFIIVVVAVLLIWGAEHLEKLARGKEFAQPRLSNWRFAGAGALALLAFGVLMIGQPTVQDLWDRIAPEKTQLLDERKVQIHPAELRSLYYNPLVNLVMVDVRGESDFNLFHLRDAQRVAIADLPTLAPTMLELPAETVFVLMSNDETLATEAWTTLAALNVSNIYILEGGLNNWLAVYGDGGYNTLASSDDESLRYAFAAALGDAAPAAIPSQHDDGIEFTPKVEMQQKAPTGKGGCG